MTGVITWVVDCGDGVCVGGKPPLHFTQAKANDCFLYL